MMQFGIHAATGSDGTGRTMVRRSSFWGARGCAALLLVALLMPTMSAQSVHAASLTVSSTSDNGLGSLRTAITQANGAPGSTIAFAIPGGTPTIALSSALPNLAA